MLKMIAVALLASACSWSTTDPGAKFEGPRSLLPTSGPQPTATEVWSDFSTAVQSATVVRLYYYDAANARGGTATMLTLHEDGRAARDKLNGSFRYFLINNEVRLAADGEWIKSNPPLTAPPDLSTGLAYVMANLASLPATVTSSGNHVPGSEPIGPIHVVVPIDATFTLLFGFDGHHLDRVVVEKDGKRHGFLIHRIVFDPPLSSDFFEPDGTVHQGDSEDIFHEPVDLR